MFLQVECDVQEEGPETPQERCPEKQRQPVTHDQATSNPLSRAIR